MYHWQKKRARYDVEGGHHKEEEGGRDFECFWVDRVEDQWAEHHTQNVDAGDRAEQSAYTSISHADSTSILADISHK